MFRPLSSFSMSYQNVFKAPYPLKTVHYKLFIKFILLLLMRTANARKIIRSGLTLSCKITSRLVSCHFNSLTKLTQLNKMAKKKSFQSN